MNQNYKPNNKCNNKNILPFKSKSNSTERLKNFLREMYGDPNTEFGFAEAVLDCLECVFGITLPDDDSEKTNQAFDIIYEAFDSDNKNVLVVADQVATFLRNNE
jgi:hypothetical protein